MTVRQEDGRPEDVRPEDVRLEDKGSYLVVHNCEDRRGAITPAFYQTIVKAIEMASDPRIRCVILTGGGVFLRRW